MRSSKQFLHFVIFNDACHQTRTVGKVLLSTPVVCCTATAAAAATTPSLLDCQLSQVCIYCGTFQPGLKWIAAVPKRLLLLWRAFTWADANLNDVIVPLKKTCLASVDAPELSGVH